MNEIHQGPKVFFSKSASVGEFHEMLSSLERAVPLLFPNAVRADSSPALLRSPNTLFFREGENHLWVEVIFRPFGREQIAEYLSKARQVQMELGPKVCGILVAPAFEGGLGDFLELAPVPLRFFRYQEGAYLRGSYLREWALWLEEIHPPREPNGTAESLPSREPRPAAIQASPPRAAPEISASWNRLSREELREFIQLELDAASFG